LLPFVTKHWRAYVLHERVESSSHLFGEFKFRLAIRLQYVESKFDKVPNVRDRML